MQGKFCTHEAISLVLLAVFLLNSYEDVVLNIVGLLGKADEGCSLGERTI